MAYLLRLNLTPAHKGDWYITNGYDEAYYHRSNTTLLLWDASLKILPANAHRIYKGTSSKHACAWVVMEGFTVVTGCTPSIIKPQMRCYFNPKISPHWHLYSGAIADGMTAGFLVAHQSHIYQVPGWALCSYPRS